MKQGTDAFFVTGVYGYCAHPLEGPSRRVFSKGGGKASHCCNKLRVFPRPEKRRLAAPAGFCYHRCRFRTGKEVFYMDPKYTADITLTQNDIKRLGKMLQGDQKKGYIFTAIALVWILYAAFFQLRNGRPMLGIFMIVVVIGCVIITLFTSGRQVRKNYEMIKAAGGDRFTVLFFDDHFETKSEKNHGTYEYAKLLNIIETDTDFYLEVAKGQCVIVQKDKCNAELCSFIRGLKK
jgi:hypothetical protein